MITVLFATDLAGTPTGGTRYVVAAVFAVLLYVSVLVHELSHSVVARGFGLPVRRILLYPLGGVSEIEGEPQTPGREFIVSAAGPFLSFVLAAIAFGLAVVPQRQHRLGHRPPDVLGQPRRRHVQPAARPAAGRRPDRARRRLEAHRPPRRGTLTAALGGPGDRGRAHRAGRSAGPWPHGENFDLTVMIWLVAIASFMWIGASQRSRPPGCANGCPHLGSRAGPQGRPHPGDLPLAEAVRRAEEANARALVVVDHQNAPIGIVSEPAVIATPPHRRPWVEAGTLTRTLDPSLILPADLAGEALVAAVRQAPATEYLLVEPTGEVYGVLAATVIWMALRRRLSAAPRPIA